MSDPVTTPTNRGMLYENRNPNKIQQRAFEKAVEEDVITVQDGHVHLDLDGANEMVKEFVEQTFSAYAGTIISNTDESEKTSSVVVDDWDGYYDEVELNEIGSKHEGKVIRTKAQIQDLGSRTTSNISAYWLCQNNHRTGRKYARWTESLDHPNTCMDDDCRDVPTDRVPNSGLSIDIQQLVLSESDKDDRNSRNLIAEVDEPLIDEFDRRETVEILARVTIADRKNDSKVEPYLHVLGYRPVGHTIDLNDEKIEELEEIAENSNDIISDLTESVAPEIVNKYGQRQAKLAVLCSLVRGANETDRNMIHSLLYGEKGSGKSRILEFADKIAENSQFADVQNSSGPGLTATAKQTSKLQGEGDQWIITGGTIPQAHQGVAFLDELDKGDERDQTLIATPMASGRVIVKKAGEAELSAETSICATANPEDHTYDGGEPLEALDLPEHIQDRFDLIIRVDDEIQSRKEEREILKEQSKRDRGNYSPPLELQELKEYVAYAKGKQPEMTDEADEQIIEYMLDLRMDYKNSALTSLEISAREQEKLTRVSSAMAKLRLGDEITEIDVHRAWNLMLFGWQSVTFDGLNLVEADIPENEGDNL